MYDVGKFVYMRLRACLFVYKHIYMYINMCVCLCKYTRTYFVLQQSLSIGSHMPSQSMHGAGTLMGRI